MAMASVSAAVPLALASGCRLAVAATTKDTGIAQAAGGFGAQTASVSAQAP